MNSFGKLVENRIIMLLGSKGQQHNNVRVKRHKEDKLHGTYKCMEKLYKERAERAE